MTRNIGLIGRTLSTLALFATLAASGCDAIEETTDRKTDIQAVDISSTVAQDDNTPGIATQNQTFLSPEEFTVDDGWVNVTDFCQAALDEGMDPNSVEHCGLLSPQVNHCSHDGNSIGDLPDSGVAEVNLSNQLPDPVEATSCKSKTTTPTPGVTRYWQCCAKPTGELCKLTAECTTKTDGSTNCQNFGGV